MKSIYQIALLAIVLAGVAAANDVPVAAPEISAGSAASAIGLVSGVLLVMRARRKK